MSVIKPRTRGKQFVQVRTRLEQQNHDVLHAYAAFIGEDPEYVLNELIDSVLAKDRDFIKWRAEHPQSFAPQGLAASPPEPRRHRGGPSASLPAAASTAARTDTRQ